MSGPFLLAILDGFALNPNEKANAIAGAKTPCFDRIWSKYPKTTLCSFGERVGLPDGQMGNSEVGHLNIGAGRIVEQELSKINRSIREKKLPEIPALVDAFNTLQEAPENALHLIGLISSGGVHSQISHIEAIVQCALEAGVQNVFIHAITDGRDRPPKDAEKELIEFEQSIRELQNTFGNKDSDVRIASVIGRYFAMDRDKRWDRIQIAYDLFVEGKGKIRASVSDALKLTDAESDEFIEASVISSSEERLRSPWLNDGDIALFCNFRADRMRQIVHAISDSSFDGFLRRQVPKLNSVLTLTEYEEGLNVEVLFKPVDLSQHLGQVISENGLRQLRIAETEKYPHVTYFFNGGEETPYKGEERIVIPSPRDVATYDLKPEMSANELTSRLLDEIGKDSFDVIILNFANCDMVGHTGDLDAAIKAVETVDSCLDRILTAILEKGGSALVTADHGNADQMIDYQSGQPHTYHTTHPVPCVFVSKDPRNRDGLEIVNLRKSGALCDLAPSILDILGLPQPAEMTGHSLLSRDVPEAK
jgi:2,3-bisphosphoglycerate-independent phosphoglycerate mutase